MRRGRQLVQACGTKLAILGFFLGVISLLGELAIIKLRPEGLQMVSLNEIWRSKLARALGRGGEMETLSIFFGMTKIPILFSTENVSPTKRQRSSY